jgi:hypothetical protein
VERAPATLCTAPLPPRTYLLLTLELPTSRELGLDTRQQGEEEEQVSRSILTCAGLSKQSPCCLVQHSKQQCP